MKINFQVSYESRFFLTPCDLNGLAGNKVAVAGKLRESEYSGFRAHKKSIQ